MDGTIEFEWRLVPVRFTPARFTPAQPQPLPWPQPFEPYSPLGGCAACARGGVCMCVHPGRGPWC